MALHPDFPSSPFDRLIPEQRCFPADETLPETAYEKLLLPLVAKIGDEVYGWRGNNYAGAPATSSALPIRCQSTLNYLER
jgi:type III restriction enzyme